MTEPRKLQYPGYDVLSKRDGMSWNDATRAAIDERLGVPRRPRYLSAAEFETLQAIAGRILPQPALREDVPLAALVDAKLFENKQDGFRHADMPKMGEAWRLGLAALNAEAHARHGRDFTAISFGQQDELLREAEAGKLSQAEWRGMPSQLFFESRIIPDIVGAYYGDPKAWSEIGFGGPASPRGYVRMQLDRRDEWEASEGKAGREAAALRENKNVR